MKLNEFEKQLQQQPLRSIPSEWRSEILRVANISMRESNASERFQAATEPLGPNSWIELFRVWRGHLAGWAFVWLLIIALKATTSNAPETLIVKSSVISPEMIVVRQEQQHLLAEFFEPAWTPTSEPPKPVVPRPRSDLPARRRPALHGDGPFHQSRMA